MPEHLPSRLWRLRPFSLIRTVVLALILTVYLRNLGDAVIHPLALMFGRPATAIVSSKHVIERGHAYGHYVELNYQYSHDYAPRSNVRVNEAAYAALPVGTNTPIHFIVGCESCIALDNDFGSARQQGEFGLLFLAIVAILSVIQIRYWRFRDSKRASTEYES